MWASQRAGLPGKLGATETAGLGLRNTVSPPSTQEDRGWTPRRARPQRLATAAACEDSSAASRSRSPRAGPPTGSAAAGHARHTSRSGLHGLGTGPHVPSLCAPPAPVPPATGPGRPPALLGGHGSYGCLGGAAPGAQGRAGGSARDARAEDRLLPSPVQFRSVVAPPEPTQASAALKVTLHRDTLTASRERSPRRLQDSPTHTGRWTGQLSSPPARATVPRGAGSFLR